MELRQLRYFVAVAEERSFRGAAKRLNISQPPLSYQIKKLEDELQLKLFQRTTRGVNLTVAGQEMLHSARMVLRYVSQAITDARRATLGQTGRISLGFTDDFLYSPLARVIATFQEENPNVIMESQLGLSHVLARKVYLGELDAAFVCPPLPVLERKVLDHMALESISIKAMLPASHPLAQSSSIALQDLASENFILASTERASGYFMKVMRLFDEAGFIPNTPHAVISVEMTTQLVLEGLGVSLVTMDSVPNDTNGIAIIPLDSKSTLLDRSVIWRPSNDSPVLREFLKMTEMSSLNPGTVT